MGAYYNLQDHPVAVIPSLVKTSLSFSVTEQHFFSFCFQWTMELFQTLKHNTTFLNKIHRLFMSSIKIWLVVHHVNFNRIFFVLMVQLSDEPCKIFQFIIDSLKFF